VRSVDVEHLIEALPKVELHVHIEGTLEPEMMFAVADRNGLVMPYASVEELKAAYDFRDLQSFLDVYYEGARVLLHERDFFDLTWAYLERMARENVRHVEIFCDPQTHTNRGVAFEAVIGGIHGALERARSSLGITSRLIPCFLRHLSAEAAMQTLELVLTQRERIAAVGLDSAEVGNPPEKFADVFRRARREGLATVAHAGEEGPPEYIWQALNTLEVRRVDHGVRCLEDESLVQHLAATRIPLTVCPLSNVRLHLFDRLEQHNLKALLERGLCVTINSDDPAYFGGYLTENFRAARRALDLSADDVVEVVRNGVEASFLDPAAKQRLFAEIDAVAANAADAARG
jgi:adenosine deaminase